MRSSSSSHRSASTSAREGAPSGGEARAALAKALRSEAASARAPSAARAASRQRVRSICSDARREAASAMAVAAAEFAATSSGADTAGGGLARSCSALSAAWRRWFSRASAPAVCGDACAPGEGCACCSESRRGGGETRVKPDGFEGEADAGEAQGPRVARSLASAASASPARPLSLCSASLSCLASCSALKRLCESSVTRSNAASSPLSAATRSRSTSRTARSACCAASGCLQKLCSAGGSRCCADTALSEGPVCRASAVGQQRAIARGEHHRRRGRAARPRARGMRQPPSLARPRVGAFSLQHAASEVLGEQRTARRTGRAEAMV